MPGLSAEGHAAQGAFGGDGSSADVPVVEDQCECSLGSGPIDLSVAIRCRLRKETADERLVLADGRVDGST